MKKAILLALSMIVISSANAIETPKATAKPVSKWVSGEKLPTKSGVYMVGVTIGPGKVMIVDAVYDTRNGWSVSGDIVGWAKHD